MQKQNKSKKTWADRRIIVGITTVLHQPKDFPAQCFISALICFNSFFFFNFLPLFLQNMQSILIKQTKKIKIHSNLFFFCTRNAFAFFATVHKYHAVFFKRASIFGIELCQLIWQVAKSAHSSWHSSICFCGHMRQAHTATSWHRETFKRQAPGIDSPRCEIFKMKKISQ